jgi:hypothetical protein
MYILTGISPAIYLYGEQLTVILGFITLILALAVIFSCRSCLAWSKRLGWKDILQNKVYHAFFTYHSYYWWGFWFIFSFHLLMGLMHIFMFPSVPDPDSYYHWYSLGFGLSAILIIGGILASCRVIVVPLTTLLNKNPFKLAVFAPFYKYHSYYWLIFIIVIALHYTFGFLHSGLWPK